MKSDSLLLEEKAAQEVRLYRRRKWKWFTYRFLMITIGAILMGIGLELFLVNNQILDGGVVGISIIVSQLTPLPLGVLTFVLNIPFFIIGYRKIGKVFALFTLYGIAVMSTVTLLLHSAHPVTDDLLLATVFGGVTLGLGVGLVIRNGGALDGTEIVSIIVNGKTPFSTGQIIMVINILIFSVAGFAFNWDRAMYSLITYFLAYKVIDIVIQGMDESKSAFIISRYYEEIGLEIMEQLGKSVTYIDATGGYSGEMNKVIFVIISRFEEVKLKSILDEIDPDAFLAVGGSMSEVKGGKMMKKRTPHL
ncbi:YitT family protein [Listeria aquatica]|uniref:YitT family protein n=1 Tax=Listeria aquatica TaxID=1494960 RepID=A0A841ZNK1_9LIST|nr:YitT family protein [Listeria aquatica]MBC1521062.1 YitT family protein [Listeria aquatica]